MFVFLAAVIICAVCLSVKSGKDLSMKIKYPVEYSDYIVKYAQEYDLDPYLVIAVIKQESNFIPDAHSKYAGGLMQLTEDTANDYAKKLGLSEYDYMEPETNIRLGCFVLSTLISKYQNIDTALAAYNAGGGNVDKWLASSEYSSDGKTLRKIPFNETRYYVEKVNLYVDKYRNHVSLDGETEQ